MTLPLSARRTVRFVPSGFDADDPKAPAYLLAVASHLLRAEFRQACTAAGMQYPSDGQLFAALRVAIKASGVSNGDDLLALVDAGEAKGGDPSLELPEGTLDRLRELQRVVAEQDEAFARLLASRVRFGNLMPLVAARMCLRGWENVFDDDGKPVPFRRGPQGVPDDDLEFIPEAHLHELGNKAVSMMTVTETQSKNSASPSRSPESQGHSQAANVQPTAEPAGGSSATSTN